LLFYWYKSLAAGASTVSNYKIVVRGVAENKSADQVAEALAKMSLKPASVFKSLLVSGGLVVKRTGEVQKAVRYKKVLEQIGCICVIEAEITPAGDQTAPSATVNLTASYDANANIANPREFQYANYPVGARLRSIAGTLRLKEWLTVVAFVSVVFYYATHMMA
jgi:hypothetical protein